MKEKAAMADMLTVHVKGNGVRPRKKYGSFDQKLKIIREAVNSIELNANLETPKVKDGKAKKKNQIKYEQCNCDRKLNVYGKRNLNPVYICLD